MFVDFMEGTTVYRSMGFAWDLGVQNIDLEGDSLRVISAIHYQKTHPSPSGTTEMDTMRINKNTKSHHLHKT